MEIFTPRFLDDERWYVGCVALTELARAPTSRTSTAPTAAIRTTATRDGDEWVVNGHWLWPTNLSETDAALNRPTCLDALAEPEKRSQKAP
jgi:alkylation response protein AidB-like acyl-CoA dehydrogenase